MSNNQVGGIYSQIIQDVIEASRVDLEENGVDESILDDLRQGWQKKLSAQQLAQFPWDPKPDPPSAAPPSAPAATAATAPIDVGIAGGTGVQPPPAVHAVPQQYPSNPVTIENGRVKTEPGVKVEPGMESMPSSAPINGNVQQRVIQNLQQTYGDRASETINRLQESYVNSQYSNQPRPAGNAVPPPQYQASVAQQQQYRQQLAASQGQPRIPPQGIQNGQKPSPSQLDGAIDSGFTGVLMRQDAAGHSTELGRVEIDRLLHAQIEARAKSMEGGGLMLPLKRAAKRMPVSYHSAQASSGPGRFDGPDDDLKSEEDDEAINSDLDDSDEPGDDDDEDEDGGQIMLCMYDKVQRVKNKWKCVLKDGVLSVNGKDYVFHKASGEYEW